MTVWNTSAAPQEAVQAINEGLKQIAAKYEELAAIAREHGLEFDYQGPAGYGDGGYFDPSRTQDSWGNEIDGWIASSQSC